ncbi:MAG TPA: nucleotidyltransferase family protein [Chloroflexia bacterium]|nr:nucleotidyltransferase family protein [Chloroflexia bacterium]
MPAHTPIRPSTFVLRQLALLTGAHASNAEGLLTNLHLLSVDDWGRVLSAAVAERLAPTIYCHLRDRELLDMLPGNWRERLEEAYRVNQALYIEQASALSQLTDAFKREGIPFRLLKGLAVAAQGYSTPTARAVGDVDLWVLPRYQMRAEQLLLRLGLVRDPSPYSTSYLRLFLGEQTFSPPERPNASDVSIHAVVDLDSHLVKPWWLRETLRVDERAIFDRPRAVTIAGRSYLTLDPTDTLHFLCLHAKGGYHVQPWRSLFDIQIFISRVGVDWDRLNFSAVEWGTRSVLWRLFTLIDRACETHYVDRLAWKPGRWHRKLIDALLPPPMPGTLNPTLDTGDSRLPMPSFLLLPGAAAMLRATLRLIWPSSRWLRMRYNLSRAGRFDLFRARVRYISRLRYLYRLFKPGRGANP